jgi:hypothetical protein
MIRRLFWLMLGFGAGVGTSVAAWRRLRRERDRFHPGRVAERVGRGVSGVGDTLGSALAEGRQAMQEREAELRRSDPRLG